MLQNSVWTANDRLYIVQEPIPADSHSEAPVLEGEGSEVAG